VRIVRSVRIDRIGKSGGGEGRKWVMVFNGGRGVGEREIEEEREIPVM